MHFFQEIRYDELSCSFSEELLDSNDCFFRVFSLSNKSENLNPNTQKRKGRNYFFHMLIFLL